MNKNKFFKNVEYLKNPTGKELVLFSCDDIYFKKFGIYNICSCDQTGQNVHVHLINPSEESLTLLCNLSKKLKVEVSYSIETFDISLINFYCLKGYFYTSRFFIAETLFKKFKINTLLITDTDIIFNEPIVFPKNKTFGINFYPEKTTLWEKSPAYFVLIKINETPFLELLLQEYTRLLNVTDFNSINDLPNKIEKANLSGVDQIGLSTVILQQQKYLDFKFLNLATLENFSSKGEYESKIWVLVGKTKNSLPENYLKNKYLGYLEN